MDRVGVRGTGMTQLCIEFAFGYKEIQGGRTVYEKFVSFHPEVRNWSQFAVLE
jgi:hypothetical protein